MESGHNLIDAAVKVCGSRYQLAKRVRVSEAFLSMVYKGKRELGPGVAAKIADVAGLDAHEAAAIAIIENEKDPAEREALKRVFSRTGAVATLLFSISAGWLAPSPATAATLYSGATLIIM
jgi:transcriptional regulator with XRE-family HTH domain